MFYKWNICLRIIVMFFRIMILSLRVIWIGLVWRIGILLFNIFILRRLLCRRVRKSWLRLLSVRRRVDEDYKSR